MGCIIVASAAVIIVMYNLWGLYESKKAGTLAIVSECAANADILEMISRMKSGDNASQSFIRLNTFIEFAQQADGEIGKADSLRTSLAALMRIGLEFDDQKRVTDYHALDSIFNKELHRHNLFPEKAWLVRAGKEIPEVGNYWSVDCITSPGHEAKYTACVSPMPGEILSQMWSILISLTIAILSTAFLSFWLIRYVRQLRTIEQMKDDFTHNMTHELKTPVAVAYSAADSMLRYYDHSDEARNRQFLEIILQRLSYLSGMIENILSVSMERFKTLHLDMRMTRLLPLAEEVAAMIRLKAEKEVEIKIDISPDLTLEADQSHLSNVLSNLLENAVKYSGESVNITVTADCGSITVADNGIGIESEHLPFIFDKFYRIPSGDRYETGGYGLGLFYVRKIIDLHGWSIEVNSRPGEGTRFKIKTEKH